MKVYCFEPTEHFGSACYVIESEKEHAIIDPSVTVDEILASTPEFSPKFIILTHTHFDHMVFLSEYKKRFPEAIVLLGKEDVPGLKDPIRNASSLFGMPPLVYSGAYQPIDNGAEFNLGSTCLRFHSYNGHTEGGEVIEAGNCLFVGDLIFDRGSYGRVDLPSGNAIALARSIKRLLESFAEDITLYPGHGPSFSLKSAKNFFEYLFRKDFE